MADTPDATEWCGQNQGLGFESGAPLAVVADEVFWSMASSALKACDFSRPAGEGEVRFHSEIRLPGKPPRLVASNHDYRGSLSFSAGNQMLSNQTGADTHQEALSDFMVSEEIMARGEPMQADEVVLGTWVLMGDKQVNATDITWQSSKLDVHVFWHRSKRTEHRYARAEMRRVLPTGQVAVQQVVVRIQKFYRQTNIDGPHNTAELGRHKDGRLVAGSDITSLEIYNDVFKPRVPLKLLSVEQWKTAIELPLVPNDILRLRKDT